MYTFLGDKMKIKDIPLNERPVERLILYGQESLSNEELLSIILNTGSYNKSSKELALDILNLIGKIQNLSNIQLNQLLTIKGIGNKKASTILSLIELSKRINKNNDSLSKIKFSSPLIVFEYYKNILKDKKQEYFYCIYLDSNNNIIEDKLLYIGTLNYSVVHPREIMKYAFILSASSIICVHNHPSLNTVPSKEDKELTLRIKEVSQLCGIKLLDHIIIGNDYYSFSLNNDII
jgi:DNA repair protein RadC